MKPRYVAALALVGAVFLDSVCHENGPEGLPKLCSHFSSAKFVSKGGYRGR